MPTSVQDKLRSIIAEIDRTGHANPTRLTVLKKWFESSGRLPAFGLWVAAGAASRGDGASGAAGAFFADARALLADRRPLGSGPDRRAAAALYPRLRAFQDVFKRQRWGPVRVIQDWNLLLIEEGLGLYLRYPDSPPEGYRLAVDFCVHYDARYGSDLNGPSRNRLEEILHFIGTVEARERAPGIGDTASSPPPRSGGRSGHCS